MAWIIIIGACSLVSIWRIVAKWLIGRRRECLCLRCEEWRQWKGPLPTPHKKVL